MENTLATGETLVKSWDYSDKKKKDGLSSNITHRNLSVTNKRIIARETDKFGATTQEIFLNDVKSISGKYATKRSVLGLIICILLAIVAATLAFVFEIYYLLIGTGVFILIGILAYIFSKQTVFALNFITYGYENLSMILNAGFLTVRKNKNAGNTNIKVYVNFEMAREIVNTIGAIILENKGE